MVRDINDINSYGYCSQCGNQVILYVVNVNNEFRFIYPHMRILGETALIVTPILDAKFSNNEEAVKSAIAGCDETMKETNGIMTNAENLSIIPEFFEELPTGKFWTTPNGEAGLINLYEIMTQIFAYKLRK